MNTYRVQLITDYVIFTTTETAEDEGQAHSAALATILEQFGLNLIDHRYQIEIEEERTNG